MEGATHFIGYWYEPKTNYKTYTTLLGMHDFEHIKSFLIGRGAIIYAVIFIKPKAEINGL